MRVGANFCFFVAMAQDGAASGLTGQTGALGWASASLVQRRGVAAAFYFLSATARVVPQTG